MNLMFIFIVAIIAYLLFRLLRSFSKPKAIDVSFLPQQFVVVDVETTGLDSEKHKIIEIGAIKVNRDSIHHDSFQAYIKIDGNLPGKITEITGITKETLDQEGRAWPGLKSYRLANLAEMGDLSTQGNHRALKDCELATTVYMSAAAKLRSVN